MSVNSRRLFWSVTMDANPKRLRLSSVKVELNVNSTQRWIVPSKYDKVHAMQYKQSFLCFGTTHPDNKKQSWFTNQKEHILSGFSGTPVDDIKGDYLWFPIPEVSMRGYDFLNNVSACESGIEFKSYDDVITLNLMDPSQQWKSLIKCPRPGFRIQPLVFNGFQKYQITVNFNVTEIIITITDKQNEHCAGQLKSTECFNEHINCAMIKDDLYVIGKDKMIVIQNLDEKIIGVKGENNLSPDFEIATPHLDSTLFVVQDILFTIGGHDSHYEPFPDIYQFDHDTLSWQIHGRTTVSRYAAQVVVFKGKNEKESVFIAGGFKQVNDPCSAVESIPVEVSC